MVYGGTIIKHQEKKPTKTAVLKSDTSASVNIRHFDDSALKSYSKQPEFQYQEDVTDLSWWTRFWRWFWNWFFHLFQFKKGGAVLSVIWQILEILLIGAGLVALIFVILKSIGIDLLGIVKRKPTTVSIPYSEFFEDINVIDFDAEIENAVSKHNYRFAVRLLYLKCLKQLSNSGLISWQIDKTNSAYINELTNDDQRNAFKTLTLQFEYVWYGEFMIDAPTYKNIDLSFKNFNSKVA